MIERDFDVPFVADLALREKQIQQNYRPIMAVHKWFARRPGTLFRALLLSECHNGHLREEFHQGQALKSLEGGVTVAGVWGYGSLSRGLWYEDHPPIAAPGNLGAALGAVAKAKEARHYGRFNIGFVDGHVTPMRLAELWDVKRDDVLGRWNRDHQPHREIISGGGECFAGL